jgi:hypothetical protein
LAEFILAEGQRFLTDLLEDDEPVSRNSRFDLTVVDLKRGSAVSDVTATAIASEIFQGRLQLPMGECCGSFFRGHALQSAQEYKETRV